MVGQAAGELGGVGGVVLAWEDRGQGGQGQVHLLEEHSSSSDHVGSQV